MENDAFQPPIVVTTTSVARAVVQLDGLCWTWVLWRGPKCITGERNDDWTRQDAVDSAFCAVNDYEADPDLFIEHVLMSLPDRLPQTGPGVEEATDGPDV